MNDATDPPLLGPDGGEGDTVRGLDRLVADLSARHRGVLSAEEVGNVVHDSYERLSSVARVRTYLLVLTNHLARERLAALSRLKTGSSKAVPQVLFVCVHNAGRSQMAAALLNHHAFGRVDVRSAGSRPVADLNPAVVESLAEIGIELAHAFPKPLTDEVVRDADVVITMGCGDACPVYPGIRYEDWDLPDPDGLTVVEVAPIRDETDRRVRKLLEELS